MELFYVCLVCRILLAIVLTQSRFQKYAAYIPFTIGTGLLYLYISSRRLQAPESSTGFTWWHELRPVHGLLWISAAVYISQNRLGLARLYLLLDVLLGWLAFRGVRPTSV